MRYITDVFVLFSQWMRDALMPISMAIVATILIVFGNNINKTIRMWIKSYHFFIRLFIFIAVCAVGYGLLTVVAAKLLSKILGSMSNTALSPIVILIFIVIGFIAERKNHM